MSKITDFSDRLKSIDSTPEFLCLIAVLIVKKCPSSKIRKNEGRNG